MKELKWSVMLLFMLLLNACQEAGTNAEHHTFRLNGFEYAFELEAGWIAEVGGLKVSVCEAAEAESRIPRCLMLAQLEKSEVPVLDDYEHTENASNHYYAKRTQLAGGSAGEATELRYYIHFTKSNQWLIASSITQVELGEADFQVEEKMVESIAAN